MSSSKRDRSESSGFSFHSGSPMRPQGAPRGLLYFYILHRISAKPTHGYEILQDIDSKTEGAWRPGPGSIYPILKKLMNEGMIKTDSKKGMETAQRAYHITPKGETRLKEAKEMFANAGKKWSSMRRIFIEMIDPKDLGAFFVDGTKLQFDMARETLEAKIKEIPQVDARFILKEYALNLDRQLDWCNTLLKKWNKDDQGSQVPVTSEITS